MRQVNPIGPVRRIPRAARSVLAGLLIAVVAAGSAYALATRDPGKAYESNLAAQSQALFGFGRPLAHGATGTSEAAGAAAVEAAEA